MQYESEFAQRGLELSGEWFVEQRALLGESIDVESDSGLVVFVEFEVPGTDFVLQFDLTHDIPSMLSRFAGDNP